MKFLAPIFLTLILANCGTSNNSLISNAAGGVGVCTPGKTPPSAAATDAADPDLAAAKAEVEEALGTALNLQTDAEARSRGGDREGRRNRGQPTAESEAPEESEVKTTPPEEEDCGQAKSSDGTGDETSGAERGKVTVADREDEGNSEPSSPQGLDPTKPFLGSPGSCRWDPKNTDDTCEANYDSFSN